MYVCTYVYVYMCIGSRDPAEERSFRGPRRRIYMYIYIYIYNS